MRSEDALRAGAVACFTHAQALSTEAQRLDEQAQSPRATALALMGAEAFATAILFTVAALLPAHRPRLPGRLDGHALAQHICTLAEVAQIMARALWAVASEFGGTTAMSRLRDLFGTLAEWGLEGLLNTETARKYDSELRRTYEEAQRAWRHRQTHPERGSDRRLWELDRVDHSEARARMGSLAYLLAAYAMLPTVVGNDQRWRAFAARVRHGLPDLETRSATHRQNQILVVSRYAPGRSDNCHVPAP